MWGSSNKEGKQSRMSVNNEYQQTKKQGNWFLTVSWRQIKRQQEVMKHTNKSEIDKKTTEMNGTHINKSLTYKKTTGRKGTHTNKSMTDKKTTWSNETHQ